MSKAKSIRNALLTLVLLNVGTIAQTVQIHKGWNLLGATEDIENINSLIPNATAVWKYENGKWLVASPSGILNTAIQDSNFSTFKSIKSAEGFWVLSPMDTSIELNTTNNQDQNNSKYFSASNSIVDMNQSIVFNYNYDGQNCSIDFNDGNKISLDSCKGSYTYSYKYARVYYPRLLSDENKVSQLTITVKNPTDEWVGQVTSLNNYAEPYEKTEDFIKDGRMYIAPSLSNTGYYWTQFNLIRPELFKNVSGDNFTLEARLKDPGSEGGISAYDTNMRVFGSKSIASVDLMGESWGTPWIDVGAGTSWNKEISELVQDFSDWRVIKLKVKDHNLSVYSDGNLIYSMPYEGSVGSILGLHFCFKGSGSVDWVKVYDSSDKLIYDRDF